MPSADLSTLSSLRDPRIASGLRRLAIHTVADLASYPAFRHAELVVGLERNTPDGSSMARDYLRPSGQRPNEPLRNLPVSMLRTLTDAEARHFRDALQLRTIGQLATWPPFTEALALVQRAARPTFSEPPSAPDALIPTLIGSTQTAMRLSSYVKDRSITIAEQSLVRRTDRDEVAPRRELLDIFTREELSVELGYLALVRQVWVNAGTHLGEIMHSLALAPGESRNIAVIDWTQRQRSSRREDTRAEERLHSEFQQTRAINEVVSSTAREHLAGMTQVDATTKTTGTGLTGGLGGGAAKSNSVSGDVNLGALGALIGLPIPLDLGSVAGASSQMASGAGGIGASYVHSNGTVQGTLLSETSGEREVLGELVQNISDATVQNSSNVRALMSTVVVEDEQEGRQRSQTRNITNYNHSHALTMQYYEVLQKYLVRTSLAGLTPVLFLPFRPLHFTIDFVKEYWPVLRRPIRHAAQGRFREWDKVIRNYDPRNNDFDAGGELTITSVKITQVRSWTSIAKVELTQANPDCSLSFPGFKLDETLALTFTGASTYFSFDVPDDGDSFSHDDDIPVDANVTCHIASDFRGTFREACREAIDDAKKKVDGDRGFNELDHLHNKKNLKDDIDAGRYALLNPNDGLTLTLDFEIVVEDVNGNTEIVAHTHAATWTYKQLHDEISEDLFNVTEVVKGALGSTADFNPVDIIEDIEDHFRLHRYGYTRYLLSMLEKEQVIDVIDHLAARGSDGGVALTRLVDPNPLAVVENFLILKLRDVNARKDQSGILATCAAYVDELRAARKSSDKWTRAETVYLPTAGLFGEAILGRSNASEFLDMRRFFNWQDSPIPNAAPAIVAVDLNQRRGADVASGLGATVPEATLAQVLPALYPMPTGLTSALQAVQNGQMFTDMSKTGDFAGILGNLSALANNSAQLAGTLSGDAMAKALDSAVALGSQVAAMTQTALSRTPAAAPQSLTEKGCQEMNIERVTATPTQTGELSEVDKARIASGGTEVEDPCDGDEPPTPSPTPPADDEPDPGEDSGEAPSSGTDVRLPLVLSVPYASVRLDLAGAAWSAIPDVVKDGVSGALSLMGHWTYAVGFDDDGGFDVLQQAIKAFLAATPGVGEVVLAVEGIKALLDFVGADEAIAAEAVTLSAQLATGVMNTLQSLVFPALKGDEWLSAVVRVSVKDGVATAAIENWQARGIPYGFLTESEQAEGGPWWAGDAWSAQLWTTAYFKREHLATTAVVDTTGALLVGLTGNSPLDLNWGSLVSRQLADVLRMVRDLMAYPDVATKLAAALGVADAQAELVKRITAAFEWMKASLIDPLDEYFTPEVNFDLKVRVEAAGEFGWQVSVEGSHDAFPQYTLSLRGPEDDVQELYTGPSGIEASAEGPVALMSPIPSETGEPLVTVPKEWIVGW
jgi:hypothetical protein